MSLFAQPPVREPLPGDLPSAGQHLFLSRSRDHRRALPELIAPSRVSSGFSSISSMPRTLLAQERTHYVQESHP